MIDINNYLEYGGCMFLKKLFKFIVLSVISSCVFAQGNINLISPMNVPNTKEHIQFLKKNDSLDVVLVDSAKKTKSHGGDVKIFNNDKVISVFFDNNNEPESLYILLKSRIDNNGGLSGDKYNLFVYDIYDSKIQIDRTSLFIFDNCFEGIDKSSNKEFHCNYKDETSVLRFLKTGK